MRRIEEDSRETTNLRIKSRRDSLLLMTRILFPTTLSVRKPKLRSLNKMSKEPKSSL
jgi:hypothetical protein